VNVRNGKSSLMTITTAIFLGLSPAAAAAAAAAASAAAFVDQARLLG
jgi:hypothetical protein